VVSVVRSGSVERSVNGSLGRVSVDGSLVDRSINGSVSASLASLVNGGIFLHAFLMAFFKEPL
jgi:hypothetical protein